MTDLVDPLVAGQRAVDILVNNACTIRRGPAIELSDQDWFAVLQVNLSARFALARAVARQLLDRGYRKVFTASLLSFQGAINVPGYTAVKSGIWGLTKALATEWAAHGSTSMRSRPGTSPLTTPWRCSRTRPAPGRSLTESRAPAGGQPTTLPALRCSRPRMRQVTSTVWCCRSTVGSWADELMSTEPKNSRSAVGVLEMISRLRVGPVAVVQVAAGAEALGEALVGGGLPTG